MTFKSLFAIPLLAAALIAAPAVATTQEEPLVIAAEDVTDAQIEAFVRAAIALEAIRKEYTTKIANAETEEAAEALKAEADQVAIQLVDKARGISAEEYLAISKAAQESADLTARIGAQVEVMREKKAAFEKQQAEAARAKDAQRAEEAQRAAEETAKDAAGDTATE